MKQKVQHLMSLIKNVKIYDPFAKRWRLTGEQIDPYTEMRKNHNIKSE